MNRWLSGGAFAFILILLSQSALGQEAKDTTLVQPEPDLATTLRAGSENLDRAYGAYQRGYYLTAFNLALPRAQKGDAAAQTLIAELYENGRGVRKDTKEAAQWYEIAAKSGNREAQFSYAVKLLKGKDVEMDREAGLAMMQEAADAGHPVAIFNIALSS